MRCCLLLATLALQSAALRANSVESWTEKNLDSIVRPYFHLHSHPELSYHEKETAACIADEWEKSGFDVTTGVGGHGVVALLKNGPEPIVMLRTDLDALPVTEATKLEYASSVVVVVNGDGGRQG